MRRSTFAIPCCTLLLAALTVVSGFAAGQTTETATQFFLKYRAAFDKAKTIDELLPYMASEVRKQIEATPAAERPKMFELVKLMSSYTDLKVTNEQRTETGATLTAEALDSTKAKSIGTIQVIKEGGAWKIAKESWSTKG